MRHLGNQTGQFLGIGSRSEQHTVGEPEGILNAGFGVRAGLYAATARPVQRIPIKRVRIERGAGNSGSCNLAMELIARCAELRSVDASQHQVMGVNGRFLGNVLPGKAGKLRGLFTEDVRVLCPPGILSRKALELRQKHGRLEGGDPKVRTKRVVEEEILAFAPAGIGKVFWRSQGRWS